MALTMWPELIKAETTADVATFAQLKADVHDKTSGPSTFRRTNEIDYTTEGEEEEPAAATSVDAAAAVAPASLKAAAAAPPPTAATARARATATATETSMLVGGNASGGDGTSCPCQNGLFGTKCELDYTTTGVYIPPANSVKSKCHGFATAAHRIHSKQLGSKCNPRIVSSFEFPRTGFGAIINYAVYELLHAVQSNRVFEFPNGSVKAFASKTCGASFRCYVAPLSSCGMLIGKHGMAWKPSSPITKGSKSKQKKGGGDGKGGRVIPGASVKGAPVQMWRSKSQRPAINPAAFGPYGLDIFTVHAVASGFMWRPNKNVAKLVDALTGPFLDPTHAVSVHVRHGDSCTDTGHYRKCHSTAVYLSHVAKMRETYGTIDTILLATDDQKVVNEVQAAVKNPPFKGMKVVVSKVDRSWYDPSTWKKKMGKYKKNTVAARKGLPQNQNFKDGLIEQRLKVGDGDPGRIGNEAAMDIELLSRGGHFVGTMSSNLGRFAFEVMASRLERMPPFASLDRGWYYGQSGAPKACKSAPKPPTPHGCHSWGV